MMRPANNMSEDGQQRMLAFLDKLDEKGIHFFLERQSPDALMATFTLVGVNVDVDFFVDRHEFSYF